ncbi:cytochrome P450 [Virgisporangium aliadipatigenens]|uniref:Cytochrome P450 n=1 Tax=Virgisporangium aliadipatigenens TaxID=741659 RepID=A0A8J3YK11_9ACTN|nr:cytochrome P450 [Virgisporangium aliadipatigenens]GIJ46844.1 cytochrome P450 [Virgisporangium aliadipatigenens]
MAADPFSAEFPQDPHAGWAALRRAGPVHRFLVGGEPIWYVTRWEEARQVLADPTLTKVQPTRGDSDFDAAMLFVDPPDHTRLRRLVASAFTARRTEGLRPRIHRIADDLLDAVHGRDEVDLIDAFAFPLPIQVICELLGVPAEDRDSFRIWSNALTSPTALDARTAGQRMREYVTALIAHKRRRPTDDLLGALLAEADDGDRLSDRELTAMVFLLLVAGHETTVNLIANGVYVLCTRPELRDRLAADPALLPSAVEEFLRYESPVATSTYRRTTRPTRIGGVTVPAGEQVMVSLLSANRDSALASDPDGVDLSRRAQHLAFGHGMHYCLGAPLARLEGQVALGTLLERHPKLTLATRDLTWRGGLLIRGLTRLPVRL